MAFSELLRGNRLTMRDDPLDRALSLMELESLSRPFRTGGGGRVAPMRQQQGGGANNPMSWVTKEARQRGLPPGVENVVYNQQPEQFEKKNRIDAQLADVKAKQQDSYNNRILANMENQEARLNETNRANIEKEKYNREQEEGRNRRAELEAKAAQQRVETQQAGATGRTGMQQAGAMSRAQLANQLARDLQNARTDAEREFLMQKFYNDVSMNQQFPRNEPSLEDRVQEAIGQAWAGNPAFGDIIYRDDKERLQIAPAEPGSSPTDPRNLLRQELLRRAYGRGPSSMPRASTQPQMAPRSNAPAETTAQSPTPPTQPQASGGMPAGPRRIPENQEEANQLARAITQDYATKHPGQPPLTPEQLNRIIAYYMGQGGQ